MKLLLYGLGRLADVQWQRGRVRRWLGVVVESGRHQKKYYS